jgi:uncharacterized protein YbjT (DUF2867 family)
MKSIHPKLQHAANEAISGLGTSTHLNKRILVLGGRGFIGRHISEKLKAKYGRHQVFIGTRGINHSANPQQRVLPLHQMTSSIDWLEALSDIDIVVNTVGILRERSNESYECVHHLAVQALVTACEIQHKTLIHISALGLENPIEAPFSVSKKRGEQALIDSQADWHIIRASLVEGEGAYGASWFQRIAKWPIHFVPERHAYIAPVRVEYIAKKVAEIIDNKTLCFNRQERIHELSNGIKYLLPDYLTALNGGRKRPVIVVPDILVRATTWLCDKLNLTPLTEGHHELLSYDNCPTQIELPTYAAPNKSKPKLKAVVTNK